MSNKEEGNGSGAFIYCILGVLTIIPVMIAWFAAKAGARYRLIKFLVFPAGFTIGNVCMFLPLAAAAFVTNPQACWDMSLIQTVFIPFGILLFSWLPGISVPPIDPAQTNLGLILTYQIIVYMVIGRSVTRSISIALYDGATARAARRKGLRPNSFRIERASRDRAYAKAAIFYENRGKVPFLGIFTVGMAGVDLDDYYA